MKKTVHFTKYRYIMITLSILLIGGMIAGTFLRGGFNLGIDFRAGLKIQVEIDPNVAGADVASVRESLAGFDKVQVQELGDSSLQRFSIILQNEDESNTGDVRGTLLNSAMSALKNSFGDNAITELGDTYVEGRFAAGLARDAALAVAGAMALILVYLWIRFRFAYAVSSLLALVHDISFMVFFIGTFQIEVSSATIAAVLTIIGYSLNDTIVIFDRIRENEKLLSDSAFHQVINVSITQSLSRTLITSLTTILAVTAIYIFTTGSIQDFALNMIVGVVVGTYSSIFIASPTLLGLTQGRRLKQKVKRDDGIAAPTLDGGTADAPASTVDSSALREQLRAQRQRKKKN